MKHKIKFITRPKRGDKIKKKVFVTIEDKEDGEFIVLPLNQLLDELTWYFERPSVQ
jgi:hypothetical protein